MTWWIRVREYADHRREKPVREYDYIDPHTGRRREWTTKYEAQRVAESWAAVENREMTYEVL